MNDSQVVTLVLILNTCFECDFFCVLVNNVHVKCNNAAVIFNFWGIFLCIEHLKNMEYLRGTDSYCRKLVSLHHFALTMCVPCSICFAIATSITITTSKWFRDWYATSWLHIEFRRNAYNVSRSQRIIDRSFFF